jgi:hypothetical protein
VTSEDKERITPVEFQRNFPLEFMYSRNYLYSFAYLTSLDVKYCKYYSIIRIPKSISNARCRSQRDVYFMECYQFLL